jgi:hypothetical protein
MGLDPSNLPDLVRAYPELHKSSLSQQGQHYCRRWGRCRACVSWALLILGAQRETDLALDEAGDEQPDDREHRPGRKPFGLLQPPGGHRRGILEPAHPRFHRRVLLLLGVEHLRICTGLRADGRGEHGPPSVLLRVWQRFDFPPRREPASSGGGSVFAGRPRRGQRVGRLSATLR